MSMKPPAFALLAVLLAATPDLKPVYQQITQRHAEAVERLQKWIALPSIAEEFTKVGVRTKPKSFF